MVKKVGKTKWKRAPNAPKRFKSAYMFYSEQQHKVIRQQNGNKKMRAADVAKMVAQSWKALPDVERAFWVDVASRDRERFEREKAEYSGPWKVPDEKDPNAPKKPQSAFLMFSNSRRKAVSAANSTLSNTELSHLLSKLWKECPDHIKQEYRDREAQERAKFKQIRAQYEQDKEQTSSSSGQGSLRSMMYAAAAKPQSMAEFSSFLPSTSMAVPKSCAPVVHPISAFAPAGDYGMKQPPSTSDKIGATMTTNIAQANPRKFPPWHMVSDTSSAFNPTPTPTNTDNHESEGELSIEDAEDLLDDDQHDDNEESHGLSMEDVEDLLEEEMPIPNNSTGFNTQSEMSLANIPSAIFSGQHRASMQSHTETRTVEQMLSTVSTAGGNQNETIAQEETQRIKCLATALGDEAVKLFIGAFR